MPIIGEIETPEFLIVFAFLWALTHLADVGMDEYRETHAGDTNKLLVALAYNVMTIIMYVYLLADMFIRIAKMAGWLA